MAKKKICGIYKFTNNINGKLYIGQSNDVWKRYKSHSHFNDDCPFHKAIKKYRFENFSFDILEECVPERLDELEIKYIKELDSTIQNRNGYNCDGGGQFFQDYDSSKEKWKAHANSDKNPWKQKDGAWRLGGNNYNARKVADNTGRIWSCVKECADALGIKSHFHDMLGGLKPMSRTIVHLDLHYEDDIYWVPKPIDELERLSKIEYKGMNTPNNKEVFDRYGNSLGCIIDVARRYNIVPSTFYNMMNGTLDFPKALALLDFHIFSENYIPKPIDEIEKYYNEKELEKYHVASNDGRFWEYVEDAAKELKIQYNNLCSMLSGRIRFRKDLYCLDLHYTNKEHINKNKEELEKEYNEIERIVYRGGESPRARKVADNTGRIWGSIGEAAKDLKMNTSDLTSTLTGKLKTRKDLYYLDLHYADDINYISKTPEQILEKIKQDNPKKIVYDNSGRFWVSAKECSRELEISSSNLLIYLKGERKFPDKIKHLGLHYKP